LFDMLIVLGFIQINGPTGDFLENFSRPEQNLLMILFGGAWLAVGFGMLRLGKYLFRGLRFLSGLLFDWIRRFAQSVRSKLRKENREAAYVGQASFAGSSK
jgi:hypothetical protein